MPADYHSHTPLCQHAQGEPEEYVQAAIEAKLSEYGISDHAPLTPEPFDDWRMLSKQLPDYFEWIERAQSAASGKIPVRAGLECDWLPGCEPWIEELKGKYNWDYLIGSVHYLSDWDFDNPAWLEKWAKTDIDDAWSRYWKTYTDMAESGLFDTLAPPARIKNSAIIHRVILAASMSQLSTPLPPPDARSKSTPLVGINLVKKPTPLSTSLILPALLAFLSLSPQTPTTLMN